MRAGIVYVESMCQVSKEESMCQGFHMAVNTDFQKGSFEKNAFKVLKGKKVKKKLVNNFENFSLMDFKLWKYIFEMFNYMIRPKKSTFPKLQTLTPPLSVRI